jgi:dTDP-4-dehydrorhamnose 3,5-epimerase
MRFVPTPLSGAFVIELDKRDDDRGFFARVFETEFPEPAVRINTDLLDPEGPGFSDAQ